MRTDSFDFSLPEELIAQTPLDVRDKCRLMVLDKSGNIEHRIFSDITEYFSEGDLLILNNTKVFPAKLIGKKPTGGKLEITLVRETDANTWEILCRGNYSGSILFAESLSAIIENGTYAQFPTHIDVKKEIWRLGKMPLPPYIKRKSAAYDHAWYQTVYAEKEGSIAAPTAGLHFTNKLLEEIREKGVAIRSITLHVGIGTFRPIKAGLIEEHRMEQEYFEMDTLTLNEIRNTRASGKKVFLVGTTTTRAIEGCLTNEEQVQRNNGCISGHTDLFIYPGYTFKACNCLITNFHLPKSTPLLLTSALVGKENLLKGYAEAISSKYSFFSYGDAMLIK